MYFDLLFGANLALAFLALAFNNWFIFLRRFIFSCSFCKCLNDISLKCLASSLFRSRLRENACAALKPALLHEICQRLLRQPGNRDLGSFNKTELVLPAGFECLKFFLHRHRSERCVSPFVRVMLFG